MDVLVRVVDRVMKPVNEVFDAIVDPGKITNFFASGSSGPLVADGNVTWTFADVGRTVSPEVLAIEENRRIAFVWDASGERARVDIRLEPYDKRSTRITITEDGWPMDDVGVKRARPDAGLDRLHLLHEGLPAIRRAFKGRPGARRALERLILLHDWPLTAEADQACAGL